MQRRLNSIANALELHFFCITHQYKEQVEFNSNGACHCGTSQRLLDRYPIFFTSYCVYSMMESCPFFKIFQIIGQIGNKPLPEPMMTQSKIIKNHVQIYEIYNLQMSYSGEIKMIRYQYNSFKMVTSTISSIYKKRWTVEFIYATKFFSAVQKWWYIFKICSIQPLF